jgi:hypothetical protein
MGGGRRIVIVRHGERVDFVFTEEWLRNCFDDAGTNSKSFAICISIKFSCFMS